MLDTDTKRRIDTARDILVGKVPDPKSQVEQITIALIYKFMDDMDAEAEELGGERAFFTGPYARYGWAKLMAPGLGGHEMLGLYGEGIAKMPENPGIPPLFRDIFKNAYLPYRDPETLRAFLKIIDEFSYDHSERLGDAFEYLLSVLGSQGDAGQFRTPRHIIDFMVEVLAPQKTDVILDPACGTAGFLISAYKHILKKHDPSDPANQSDRSVKPLTPDDRSRLAKNFKGYDISPDMVRLSLVNLYLHGFTDPHIYEYDTLTSEERWNEFADVILANPPFMSPKGGIKPHKRFSIQAKRSEVLFVDYMAEHLTPTGRAGIIVPEGIIFQSQDAYKALRKMLVETSLVAVISLPAGCFNPYSGVKTSILILDKSLAKQAPTIAFFKVENDGFGLGAQRRAIEKNDLPQVQAELAAYLQALRSAPPSGQERDRTDQSDSPDPSDPPDLSDLFPAHTTAQIVPKAKIAANGDYNLSGERYREASVQNHAFPLIALGEIAEVQLGKMLDRAKHTEGKLMPYLRNVNVQWESVDTSDLLEMYFRDDELEKFSLKSGDVLVCEGGEPGRAAVWDGRLPDLKFQKALHRVRFKAPYEPSFFVHLLRWQASRGELSAQSAGAGIQHLPREVFLRLQVPLVPLEVQQEIVAEIEGYQKVINGARAVLDHYRPHIPIHPDWPMVRLADVCETITDGDHQPPPKANEGVPFVTITNISDDHELDFTKTFFVPDSYYENLSPARKPRKGDILYSVTGSYGIPVMVRSDRRFCFQRHIAIIRPAADLSSAYLHSLLSSPFMLNQGHEAATGVAQKTVSLNALRNFKIPLPPLTTQQAIVAEIEAEQALVAANRELITRFDAKIQATLARIWGEETPANPEA